MSTFWWPEWQVHPQVRVLVSRRHGTLSPPPWQGFNPGLNTGDDVARVTMARARLAQQTGCTLPPFWLHQVHGVRVAAYGDADNCADGAFSCTVGQPCVVLTADCLPILLARNDGSAVAALHGGWRGLLAGIIEQGVQALAPAGEALSAWLGPAIGACCYQVGDAVRDDFVAAHRDAARAFTADGPGHWRCSLTTLARQRLHACGVQSVAGGDHCTHCLQDDFYSFRRDGDTGRFASLIWLAHS